MTSLLFLQSTERTYVPLGFFKHTIVLITLVVFSRRLWFIVVASSVYSESFVIARRDICPSLILSLIFHFCSLVYNFAKCGITWTPPLFWILNYFHLFRDICPFNPNPVMVSR